MTRRWNINGNYVKYVCNVTRKFKKSHKLLYNVYFENCTNKYKYNFRNRKRNNTLIKILINVKLMWTGFNNGWWRIKL